MKLGMFTSGYQRYPLRKAFKDAKRFGYDYIELWGGRPHAFAWDLKHGELKEVLHLIDKFEMPVEVYTPEHNGYPFNYMMGSQDQWDDSIAYLKMCLDMGHKLGAEYTLISAGHAGYLASKKEIRKRLLKTLHELAAYAEKIGHTILLEPLTSFESNVCNTAGDLAEILESVNSPCLTGMCDVVVPFLQREPVLDYFRKLGSDVSHLHLVDSDGISENHVLPGEGVMPLKELLWEIMDFGYDGRVTIELVTAYLNEPSLYARKALLWLQEQVMKNKAGQDNS